MYIKYVCRSYELIQLNVRNLMSTIVSMKASVQLIFYLSLFVTLLMGILSYLSYRRYREKEFSHLTEFWAALGINTLMLGIFSYLMPELMALSMIGWLWPIRGFRLYLKDISELQEFHRWKYLVLGAGAFISASLAGYKFEFVYYTLPFSLAVSVVGFTSIRESVLLTKNEDKGFLHSASYMLIGFFFLCTLAFPFWRIQPRTEFLGVLFSFILNIGFAGVTLSAYLEVTKKRHDKFLSDLIKERNDRLLGQSKYAELGMMSAGIAHEINNPLAVIQARTTQLLRIYRDVNKQKEMGDGLQQILYTSERITRTIQGVREFVHQDEKGPKVDIELKYLVDDVLAFCGQRMRNHGINLRFYGLENVTVSGNKVQLEQVILNLLNNSFDAIEFLPDKWIEISAEVTNSKIHIYIKDSGSGIPDEVAAHMMEPFYSTKDLGKGTGLGLALAKGILEKHGGNLKYVKDSAHTTFLVELPREAELNWGIPLH